MTTYGFTLHLDRTPADEAWFDGFVEAVYPHARDCTAFRRSGVAYLGFDRDASSLIQAVASAVASVRKADPSVTVVGIELDDGRSLDELIGPAVPEEAVAAGRK